jgi:hypothetical protein
VSEYADPQYVFPLLLLVAAALIAKFWPARKDVAAAGLADAQGWDLLIENLREEVQRLHGELDRERTERAHEQQRHQRDLAMLRTEVARLQRKVEPPG